MLSNINIRPPVKVNIELLNPHNGGEGIHIGSIAFKKQSNVINKIIQFANNFHVIFIIYAQTKPLLCGDIDDIKHSVLDVVDITHYNHIAGLSKSGSGFLGDNPYATSCTLFNVK